MKNRVSAVLFVCAGSTAFADPPTTDVDVNSIGMEFVRIEAGEFQMGSPGDLPRTREEWSLRDADESPAHRVHITKAFSIGRYEVTNAQYEQFDPEHGRFRGKSTGEKDDDPVAYVRWSEAVAFCKWLSKRERKPCRLPTEAEWEYACRAGTTTKFSFGDTLSPRQANYGVRADGKPQRRPVAVGSYPANDWGLYDMHGNVAEWCHDWYGPYAEGEHSDPVGRNDGIARVARGWSIVTANSKPVTEYVRSANRHGFLPEDANRYTGFRVVIGELPTTKPLPAAEPQPFQRDVKQVAAPKGGPDPAEPYFVDYGRERKQPTVPPESWGPLYSKWNHYTTCCVCPNGDVLMAWYTTISESGRECSQAVSRLRVGSDTWEPASSFVTVPDVNCHAPVLFCDGKRIYHFFNQSFRGWDFASICLRTSDDNGATWTRPRIILDREAEFPLSQPCSAVLAKDGSIVVAIDGNGHRDERVIVSRDRGATWRVGTGDMRDACGDQYVLHPAMYQRRDGSLFAFLRGQFPMPAVVSKDMGDSWEMVKTPFPGISVGQKPAVLRLESGALVFCSADSKRVSIGGNFAAMSLDDGKTWPHVRKLDNMYGYMGLAQAPNGVVYLTGGRGRSINVVAFNEAWLREGPSWEKAVGDSK